MQFVKIVNSQVLDDELSIAYKKMWKTQNDKTNLKNDQFAWIKEDRDKCLSI